ANLFSNMGTLEIKSSPDGANVFLDGKPHGKTPFLEKIEQGEHKIRVELKGYNSHDQNVVVTKEAQKDVSITLQLLPGKLNVKTNPTDASVTLNDRQCQNSPVEIKDLAPGDYKLKVEKEGCDPVEKDIRITAGETSDVLISLDSNWGGIDLVANPPGVTIYIDGKKVGISVEGEDKLTSKVFEIRSLSSQEHTVRVAHKRAVPAEKEIKVKVEKGQIARPKPMNMWIADTYVKLKNGRETRGKLSYQNDVEIIFEPEPGVTLKYAKNEIETIRELKENE
ncbi:MAG: PEGA domain-containing protein, partial [Lentisphaerae bacterium]|nr:PEGA domain-containing protein [Lentisphaerota bacterium]